MNAPLPIRIFARPGIRRCIAIVAFLGVSWHAAAQRRAPEVEPQLFRFGLTGGSLGFYGEGTEEETSYKSGLSSTYQRTFEGPLLGLGAEGSIYHPNLFQFNLAGDGALGWTQEKVTTSLGTTMNRSSFDFLGNAYGNATVLANKPYHSSLFATRNHNYRDYDFFNRVTVDGLRYGVNTGYRNGPLPFHLTLSRQEEDTTGFGSLTSLQQTTLNLDAHNDRSSGKTSFRYTYDDFQRSAGSRTASGIGHSFGISDRETFGGRKNIELNNSLGYATREFTDSPSQDLSANSDLTIKHRPNLTSSYYGNYYRNEVNSVVAENYDTSAGIQHRLFASLTSGLRVRVSQYNLTSPAGSSESTQYLGTWSESYTKRLSDSARLTIGGSIGRSHADQKSSSVISMVGEAHTFNSGGALPDSFFLNLPNVNESTIEVFDQTRAIHYIRGVDYSVSAAGLQTMIRLIEPNPSGLTRTTPVLVDYQAAAQGTGSSDGLLSDAQIRLDLFNGMWGIYGRFNSSDYTADKGVLVQDVTSIAFGVDFSRNWLRAGIEYQIYDATFSAYNSLRLYQTMLFRPEESSTLTLNFAEGWTDYKTASRTEQFYSFISQYHHALTRHLGLDLDAGVSQRFGADADQTQAAVRPGFSYTLGRLSVKAGYDFEYLESLTQERVKHMVFIRASRSF